MQSYRPAKLRMIIEHKMQNCFLVTVRLGCMGYVMEESSGRDSVLSFYRKKLPYRIEEYPTLSTYWKIRLLK